MAKWLLVLPTFAALFTVAMLMYMAGLFDPTYYVELASSDLRDGIGLDLSFVMMTIYNLLPAVALAVLITVSARHLGQGLGAVAAGAVAMTAATVYLLVTTVTDESSTAALGLLVYPVMLGMLLVPFAGVAALMHYSRSRRVPR